MVKPFRPRRTEPRQHWWQPGLYASVPAVMLWIAARLPAGLLDGAIGVYPLPLLLNHVGDTVFVAGWLASGLWLWLGRGHAGPLPGGDHTATTGTAPGSGAPDGPEPRPGAH